MSVKTVEYWEVYDNFSEDGRVAGFDKILGRFSTEKAASQFADGRGNYGNRAQVKPCKIVIVDTVEEQAGATDEADRQNALRKLSKRERTLLGVTWD